MKRRRVKITGLGPVTPAGVGRDEFWPGILDPVSRIRAFTKLGPEMGPFVAAYIEKFHIEDYVDKAAVPKGAARHTVFAIAGAVLALRDAGLTAAEFDRMNAVVVAGSSLMDFDGISRTIEGVATKGIRGAQPRTVYTTNAAVIPASIVQTLGVSARAMAIQTSCCAGMDAIGQAVKMVAFGEADIAICGGTEAPLYRTPLVELRATGLTPASVDTPRKQDRPFDLWRTTGVVSEGAAMLVIEAEDSPRPGYSFISGYAHAMDLADRSCSGMTVAMKLAIADARLNAKGIDVVNAWGPGHRQVDAAEAEGLKEIFGTRLPEIPVHSIKGALGNPLGAAPAMQVVTAALAQRHGMIPPTVNWEFPDPACPLNLSGHARAVAHDTTLINAHGLSGVNSSLVLTRC